jgi:hypothetical protein
MNRWIAKALTIASASLLLAAAALWIRSETIVDEISWVSDRGNIGLVTGGAGVVFRSMHYADGVADQGSTSRTLEHITAMPDDAPSSWRVRYAHTDRSSSLFVPFWIPLSALASILVLAHFGAPGAASGNLPTFR